MQDKSQNSRHKEELHNEKSLAAESPHKNHIPAVQETDTYPSGRANSLKMVFPEGVSAAKKQQMTLATEMKMYRGPLPPAEEMRGYEAVCPGAADRIIRMAEDNNRCNNNNRDKILRHNVRFENLGLAAGFLALLAAYIAAFYAALYDHDAVAVCFLGLAVTGTIKEFISVKAMGQKEKT